MFIRVCALSVLCLVAYAVVSHLTPALSFGIKLAGTVLLFGGVLLIGEPVVSRILSLPSLNVTAAEYANVVLRATGIAILSHICADVCRDAGHASVGDAVILASKLEIVLISLPIIERIIGYASEIMSVR